MCEGNNACDIDMNYLFHEQLYFDYYLYFRYVSFGFLGTQSCMQATLIVSEVVAKYCDIIH